MAKAGAPGPGSWGRGRGRSWRDGEGREQAGEQGRGTPAHGRGSDGRAAREGDPESTPAAGRCQRPTRPRQGRFGCGLRSGSGWTDPTPRDQRPWDEAFRPARAAGLWNHVALSNCSVLASVGASARRASSNTRRADARRSPGFRPSERPALPPARSLRPQSGVTRVGPVERPATPTVRPTTSGCFVTSPVDPQHLPAGTTSLSHTHTRTGGMTRASPLLIWSRCGADNEVVYVSAAPRSVTSTPGPSGPSGIVRLKAAASSRLPLPRRGRAHVVRPPHAATPVGCALPPRRSPPAGVPGRAGPLAAGRGRPAGSRPESRAGTTARS